MLFHDINGYRYEGLGYRYLLIIITMVLVLQWLDYYFIVTVLRIVVFVSLLSSE